MEDLKYITDRTKGRFPTRKCLFWESIYLPEIIRGLGITIRHFFTKKVTTQYPEQKRPLSPVFRGRHVLMRDEGRERCTACGMCALACPAEAITMKAAEREAGEENLYREEKYQRFTKSICCVASSADCAKKPVRKKPSI